MTIQKINLENFSEKIVDKEKLVIVEFFADWCGPCKMMAPLLDELAIENNDIKIYKVDTDESPQIAAQYQINYLPTFVSFKDGKVHKILEGPRPKVALLAGLK